MPEIHRLKLDEHASELYMKNQDAEKLARDRRLPTGERIDYILAVTLPGLSTPEYQKIENEIDKPHVTKEDKAVRNGKLRAFFEGKCREFGLIVHNELGVDEVSHYAKIHVPFKLLCNMAEKVCLRKPLQDKEAKLMAVKTTFQKISQALYPKKLLSPFETDLPNDPDISSAEFKWSIREVGELHCLGAHLINDLTPIPYRNSSTSTTRSFFSTTDSAAC